MALKTVFVVLACVTLALSFNIDSRAKRQATDETNARTPNDITNTNAQSSLGSGGSSGASDASSNSFLSGSDSASDFPNGFQNAQSSLDIGGPSDASDVASSSLSGSSIGSDVLKGFQNAQSSLGGVGSSGASDAANSFLSGGSTGSSVFNGFQNAGSRLQDAFNATLQEKDSVSDSWNNVKKLIHQNIETGANLTKTAFDLGTVFPKFGKNLIFSN